MGQHSSYGDILSKIDAQGDLLVGSADDTLKKLPIGAAGQVLGVNATGDDLLFLNTGEVDKWQDVVDRGDDVILPAAGTLRPKITNEGTQDAFEINQIGVLAGSRHALEVESDVAQTAGSSYLGWFRQNNTGTAARGVGVTHQGSGIALRVDANGTGKGLDLSGKTGGALRSVIDAGTVFTGTILTSGNVFNMDSTAATGDHTFFTNAGSGHNLSLRQENPNAATKYNLVVQSEGSQTLTDASVKIIQNGTDTTTANALSVNHDGTTDSAFIELESANARLPVGIDMSTFDVMTQDHFRFAPQTSVSVGLGESHVVRVDVNGVGRRYIPLMATGTDLVETVAFGGDKTLDRKYTIGDTTGGDILLRLPAPTIGDEFTINKKVLANKLTVDTIGAAVIYGASYNGADEVIMDDPSILESLTVFSDGTDWYIK